MATAFKRALEQATSEDLLESDLAKYIAVLDHIRGMDVAAKTAVGIMRKRLMHRNPNVALKTLEVIEMAVKNCGAEVQSEVATDSFMADMRKLLKSESVDLRNKVLEVLQIWALAFEKQPAYRVVVDTYNVLRMEGYPFPPADPQADAMFVAERPPEWKEGKACYSCRTTFGITVRRHHCRNCGQIFCQQCSSKNTTISRYGIEKPVRVCDTCYDKIQKGENVSTSAEEDTTQLSDYELLQRLSAKHQHLSPEEQVAKMMELESQQQQQQQQPSSKDKDKDKEEARLKEEEELQLALALSLSEQETNKGGAGSYPQLAPQSHHQPSPPQQQQQQQLAGAGGSGLYNLGTLNEDNDDAMASYLRRMDPSARQSQPLPDKKQRSKRAPQQQQQQRQRQRRRQDGSSKGSSRTSSRSQSRGPSRKQQERRLEQQEQQKQLQQERVEQAAVTQGAGPVDTTVAEDDRVIETFDLYMRRLEEKLQRALARGGGVKGDPTVQGIADELQGMHRDLFARMDRLETDRDSLIDMAEKYGKAKETKAALVAAHQEYEEQQERARREQELLERMHMERKMQLLKQQEEEQRAYQMRMEQERQAELQRQQQLAAERERQRQEAFTAALGQHAPAHHHHHHQHQQQYQQQQAPASHAGYPPHQHPRQPQAQAQPQAQQPQQLHSNEPLGQRPPQYAPPHPHSQQQQQHGPPPQHVHAALNGQHSGGTQAPGTTANGVPPPAASSSAAAPYHSPQHAAPSNAPSHVHPHELKRQQQPPRPGTYNGSSPMPQQQQQQPPSSQYASPAPYAQQQQQQVPPGYGAPAHHHPHHHQGHPQHHHPQQHYQQHPQGQMPPSATMHYQQPPPPPPQQQQQQQPASNNDDLLIDLS